MEFLEVDRFLSIKKANIEINKINIIIGPQANGKSILAKLSYFFRTTSVYFLKGIEEGFTKTALDNEIKDNFERFFPVYAWDKTSFVIRYKICDVEFKVEGVVRKSGKTTLDLSYSKELNQLFISYKKKYKKGLEDSNVKEGKKGSFHSINKIGFSKRKIFDEIVLTPLKESNYSDYFSESTFIPASRTFYSTMHQNIFSFLNLNIEIDPFLKAFGSLYETSKFVHSRIFDSRGVDSKFSENYFLDIVKGKYDQVEDKDSIVSNVANKKFTYLVNASSGQQEALPMLLVLTAIPVLNRLDRSLVFIEEPEAHLFPTSQSKVISLVSEIHNQSKANFFITTHSPYIISSLNNLILGGMAVEKGYLDVKGFESINKGGAPLSPRDISAYTIENGVSKSIMDQETGLIGCSVIDQVSEHFSEVMGKILDLGDF